VVMQKARQFCCGEVVFSPGKRKTPVTGSSRHARMNQRFSGRELISDRLEQIGKVKPRGHDAGVVLTNCRAQSTHR
jgi:hypothetical protein